MNPIVRISAAIAIGFGLAAGAYAQGRHDEKPHGYDAKLAGEEAANPTQDKYVVLPGGPPMGHDNPINGRKIKVTPTTSDAPATNPISQGAERK